MDCRFNPNKQLIHYPFYNYLVILLCSTKAPAPTHTIKFVWITKRTYNLAQVQSMIYNTCISCWCNISIMWIICERTSYGFIELLNKQLSLIIDIAIKMHNINNDNKTHQL